MGMELESSRWLLEPTPETFGLGVKHEYWEDVSSGRANNYYKYSLPDVAQVMGITTEGQVIVIGEFQPGLGKNYPHLIGETLEPGEEPLVAARRGLQEETGYDTEELSLVSSVLQDSGRSDRLIHLVLAVNCRKVATGEADIAVTLLNPLDFWANLTSYFLTHPAEKHGAGNSLKLATLAFSQLGLLTLKGSVE